MFLDPCTDKQVYEVNFLTFIRKFYIIKRESDGISISYEDELNVDEVLKIIREGAPDDLNTFIELIAEINKKVDKIPGKNLSTNDFTNEDKERLYNISVSSNYYFDEPYIGNDEPGTGNNILLHGN